MTACNYCHDCDICGGGSGLMVGGDGLVVGGGSVCGDWDCVITCVGFQRSCYADLTP